MADLTLDLAGLKAQLADLKTENSKLKEELDQLRHSKTVGDELIFKDGLYYLPDDDGPFCAGCYDSEGKKIRLTDQKKGAFSQLGDFKCPTCDTYYG